MEKSSSKEIPKNETSEKNETAAAGGYEPPVQQIQEPPPTSLLARTSIVRLLLVEALKLNIEN